MKFNEPGIMSYRAFRFDWDGGQAKEHIILYEVHEGNTYEYKDSNEQVSMTIDLIEQPNFGYNEAHAFIYDYGPLEAEFAVQPPYVLPIRIWLDHMEINTIKANLAFHADYFGFEDPENIQIYQRKQEGYGLFEELESVYNPVTRQIIVEITKWGEIVFAYTAGAVEAYTPILNSPAKDAAVNQNLPVDFTWSQKGYANYFDLEVATDSTFTNIVLEETDLIESQFTWESPQPNRIYYWRVRVYNDYFTETAESGYSMSSFKTVQPMIHVSTPNGDEAWQRGLRHFITWQDNIDEDVVLELYKDGAMHSLIDTVSSIGAYQWNVPFTLDPGKVYQIRIQSATNDQLWDLSDRVFFVGDTIVPGPAEPADSMYLSQNYPNPFSSSTSIEYALPSEASVKLEVFNIAGEKVAVLSSGIESAGVKTKTWTPARAANGIYFYRIEIDPTAEGESTFSAMRKMMIVR
jgi:hypothetical protein